MMLGAKPDGKKPKGEKGVSVFFMVGMLDVGMGLGWGFHRRVGLGYLFIPMQVFQSGSWDGCFLFFGA